MKKIIIVLIGIFLSFGLFAQGIIGAWETTSNSENGDLLRSVVIFVDGYQVLTTYDATTGKFIHTNGGTWSLEGEMMTETVEFHSDKPELVATQSSFKVRITDFEIDIVDYPSSKLTRLDNGEPGALQGAWLMSGRIRNGETQLRDTNRPRKTMKIYQVLDSNGLRTIRKQNSLWALEVVLIQRKMGYILRTLNSFRETIPKQDVA